MTAKRPSALRAGLGLGLALVLGLLCGRPCAAREVHLSILHTTDLHGHLLPTYIYTGEEGVGGLLRCATLIRDARKEQPNSLLLDAGDLIQGGMESHPSRGAVMIQALDALGYDAWVIGNHEFDWGLENLAAVLEHSATPVLGGNIGSPPGVPHPLPRVQPFILREVDGLRVAIVGLTTPGMPYWFPPPLLGSLLFERSRPALDRILPEVRARQPHVIVLLVHQGWRHSGDSFANEVQEIAREFPEIDIIIGGHSHQVVASSMLGRTLYTQAGYHGNWLGRIDLIYDLVQNRLTSLESRLLEVGRETPSDEALSALLAPVLAKEPRRRAKGLARTRLPLSDVSDFPGQSPQQRLIAEAIQARVGADIVLHGALGEWTVPPGPVSEYDLWRMVPYENLVGVLALTAEEIAGILEENAGQFGRPAFMGVHGLRYDLEPSAAAGRRVSNLTLDDGSRLHPRRRYRVAVNSYVLASGGQRFLSVRELARRPECRLELTDVDTREAVRDCLHKKKNLDLPPLPGARMVTTP